ncbi:MAG: hypothetical protein ACOZAL_01785 [Patescibacteria group bacterium]
MEKEPKISPEELKKKGEEARKKLQEDLDEAVSLSEEEIEKRIFSIEGVEKGKDWEKMKEHLRKKRGE